jgi:hypothetical protein
MIGGGNEQERHAFDAERTIQLVKFALGAPSNALGTYVCGCSILVPLKMRNRPRYQLLGTQGRQGPRALPSLHM